MVEYATLAPIAQWIERRPPEPKTRVRVAVGVQTQTQYPLTYLFQYQSGTKAIKDFPHY